MRFGNPRWQTAAWALAALYFVLFLIAPISGPGNQNRLTLLVGCLAHPEEMIASWCGDPPRFACWDRVPVALWAAAIVAVAATAGRLALAVARADRGLARGEIVFFSAAVGLSLLSLFTLAFGLAGHARDRVVFVGAGVLVVMAGGVWSWQRYLWRLAATVDEAPRPGPAGGSWWLLLAIPFAAAVVLGGMLPPIDFDVREYHLQAPKEFYQLGRIEFLPHNVYANMPLSSEMFSLASMALVGDWWRGALVGKTVIAACTLLTALGLLAGGRRLGSATAGGVAALVYVSIPWVAQVSTSGLIEGVSAMYLWGTVYAVLLCERAGPGEALPRLALAGFLAGSAVACKYPAALFVLAPLLAYVCWRTWQSSASAATDSRPRAAASSSVPSRARRSAPLAVCVLAAAVACGPWFAKNWYFTGNPTYPLLYEWFGGATRTAELDAQWRRAHAPPGYGLRQLGAAAADVFWRSPWLSPLVAPLALLALAWPRERRLAWGLAAYVAFVMAAWWLATHRIDRFWVPVLPVASLLAGLGFARATAESSAVGTWGLRIALVLGLAVNLVFVAGGGGGYNAYFVPLAQLRVDPQRAGPWRVELNDLLPPGRTVLCVGEAQVFDYEFPLRYNTVFDASILEALLAGRTPQQQRQSLAEHRVAYVFVHWPEIARYRSPGNYGFSDYVTRERFDELVRSGVLSRPESILSRDTQLFTVRAP